jgi:hypothetical protein
MHSRASDARAGGRDIDTILHTSELHLRKILKLTMKDVVLGDFFHAL